jgi:centrosomal protein CEP19
MSLFNYGKIGGGINKTEPLTLTDKNKPASVNSKENQISNSIKITNTDFAPKRFGLVYDPPTIILEYLVPSSGKLYHHKMKMLKLKGDSDSQETVDYLRKRHAQYFTSNKISDEQIIALIDRLKKKLPKGGAAGNASTGTGAKKDALDLLFDSKLGAKKDEKKTPLTLAPTNTNSDAAKLGKLAPLASNSTTKSNNVAKPDEEEDIFSKTSTNFWDKNKGANTTNTKKDEPKAADFWGSEGEDEDVDYNHTNLNKLSNEELKKHKDKMSVLFNQNQKKPGDADFIYDKQEEFDPQEENEWDEEF